MSKRKRDVAFLKPDEPAFISRLKALAGYKEGPTVDTKREALSFEDGDSDHEDELPQVVVVKEGDLSAEEASKIQQLKEEGPADLTQRVVFRKPENAKKSSSESLSTPEAASSNVQKNKGDSKSNSKSSSSKVLKSKPKTILSFNEDENEES